MREVSVGFKLAPIGTKLNSEGGEALKDLIVRMRLAILTKPSFVALVCK